MRAVDLVLLRDSDQNAVSIVAFQGFNLVLQGPSALANEADLLNERDRLQACLVDGVERPTQGQLNEFGRGLAAAIFPSDIRDLVKVDDQTRLRLGICTTDTQLKRIPWEYLTWPGKQRSEPNLTRTVARIVPLTDGASSPPTALNGRPLKVCVVVANPPDKDFVPWDELKESLDLPFKTFLASQGITSNVAFTYVHGASAERVNTALGADTYDVVHFIGHGERGGLFMYDRDARSSSFVDASAVAPMFARESVQLVILSACKTARQAPNETLPTLCERIVEERVPAVVGSQMEVTNNSVAPFCAALYQRLLTTGDVDEAVGNGRAAISIVLGSSSGGAKIEWGIPILYRRPGRSVLFARGPSHD